MRSRETWTAAATVTFLLSDFRQVTGFSGPQFPPLYNGAHCAWGHQMRSRAEGAVWGPHWMTLPSPTGVPTVPGGGASTPGSAQSSLACRGAPASPRRSCWLPRKRGIHRRLCLLPQDCIPPRAGRGSHEEAVPRPVLHVPHVPPPAGWAELLPEGWAAPLQTVLPGDPPMAVLQVLGTELGTWEMLYYFIPHNNPGR